MMHFYFRARWRYCGCLGGNSAVRCRSVHEQTDGISFPRTNRNSRTGFVHVLGKGTETMA